MQSKQSKHIDDLPPEIQSRYLEKLSVVDKLLCERVSPFWKKSLFTFFWSKQTELYKHKLFWWSEFDEYVNRFTNESLIGLFRHVSVSLVELDLSSFRNVRFPDLNFLRVTEDIAQSLHLLPMLRILGIGSFSLRRFVDYLPGNLRQIRSTGEFDEQTLTKLAQKCPEIEWICFSNFRSSDVAAIGKFLIKYPSLKTLILSKMRAVDDEDEENEEKKNVDEEADEEAGSLATIGELKKLEDLRLHNIKQAINETAFNAITLGCQSLQRIYLTSMEYLTEESLCNLSRLQNVNLICLEGLNNVIVTNAMIKAISNCQNLKTLAITPRYESVFVTDDSVIYLIEHCKYLVDLDLENFCYVTIRSLEAAIAEVKRRYGDPPRTLPKCPSDRNIFCFNCEELRINEQHAREMTAQNPWIVTHWIPRECPQCDHCQHCKYNTC